jgi:exosome complex RNA-binding protein Rrp42 (RNase PH superfamily)
LKNNNKDTFFRSDNRQPEQMRPVNIIPEFISTAVI